MRHSDVGVSPWLLDVAQNLVRVVKEADHFGEAKFTTATESVTVTRSSDGISIQFGPPWRPSMTAEEIENVRI